MIGKLITVSAPYAAGYTQIAAGNAHTLAIDLNGYLLAWGRNSPYGQVGDETTDGRSTPVPVRAPAGVKFTQVAAGYSHSLALDSTGKAWAWGYNSYGSLGDGTNTHRLKPVAVSMPSEVTFTQISAGLQHSLALDSTGKAWAWGRNVEGQLGEGTTTERNVPTAVSMPTDVTFAQIAGGANHSLAVTSTGTAYAWGHNNYGQLGDGTTTNRAAPTPVSTGVAFTKVSAGTNSYTSFGLTSTGVAYAWGNNTNAQIGDGTTTNRSVPTAVTMPADVTFSAINGDGASARAIGKQNGNGYGWGSNGFGQVGDNSTTTRTVPTLMTMPGTSFTQISSNSSSGIALGADGRAYGWGYNGYGQIGNGTTTDRKTPGAASSPTTAVSSVRFDGVLATGLTSLGNGRWQVKTPAHIPGKVDVVLAWSYGGVAQTALTFTEGFEYVLPKVEITTVAYSDATRTTVIAKESVLTPGSAIYWKYTIKNTGKVTASIEAVTRNADVLVPGTVCLATTLAVDATTTCTAQSTV